MSGSQEIPTLPSEVVADHGPARYALGQNGQARLLLPVGASEKVPKFPDTPALLIIDASYVLDRGGPAQRFLDLTCKLAELEGVFAEVAEQILKRIAEGHAALRACTSTLSEFRMLLASGESTVTGEQIVGLVGELLLLNEFLDLSVDACALWRGPLGERHDFRGGRLAIEVKTATRTGNEKMQISSIDQLLEPFDGELCVVRYTLERSAGGSVSVASQYKLAASRVADTLQLRSLMATMGCTDPMSSDWNVTTYELQEVRTYSVGADFPRLTPASLTTGSLAIGVSEVNYVVDLTTARPFLLEDGEAHSFRERMVACLPG